MPALHRLPSTELASAGQSEVMRGRTGWMRYALTNRAAAAGG